MTEVHTQREVENANVDRRDQFFLSKTQKQMLRQVGSKHTLFEALLSNPQLVGRGSIRKSAHGTGRYGTQHLDGADLAIPVICGEPETCSKLLRAEEMNSKILANIYFF